MGFKGGNYRTFISWAKKTGLLNSDGTPSQLYKAFRNPTTSKTSLAQAIKNGYSELYSRNEYCHALDKKGFKGLVMEATGEPHDSKVVELIVSTFFNTKTLADFETKPTDMDSTDSAKDKNNYTGGEDDKKDKVSLGLNYTINLVLPKTDDPAVFNAIFNSLRENLLKD